MNPYERVKRTDTDLYRIGKWIWIPVIIAGILFAQKGVDFISGIPFFRCRFRSVTGFPCPGCGGTHAVTALFKGRFLESLKEHAAVPYMVLAYLHFMGLYFTRAHITKTIDSKPVMIRYYAYGLVIVIFLQWFVKLGLMLILMFT